MKSTIGKALSALLVIFSLLLVSSVASAADPSAEASGYMDEILGMAYDKTDLAHVSLSRLYGGFIFEPFGAAPGNAPTALAVVLGYTNIVALILGTVIMSYVILAGAMNTAASGEMLGRSWSSVWLPLRTATAFGLIMPSAQGDTFSVAQALVVWMIIVGSNSATWIWEKGTDALVTGSPVMATTVHIGADSYAGFAQIMHCSAVRDNMLKLKDKDSPGARVTVYKNPDPSKNNNQTVTQTHFSGLGGVISGMANTTSIVFDGCGSISLPTGQAILEDTDNGTLGYRTSITKHHKDIQKAFDAAVAANLGGVLNQSLAFANSMTAAKLTKKRIEAAESTGGEEAKNIQSLVDLSAVNLQLVGNAYEAYVEAVRVASVPPNVAASWKESINEGGWMRAGVWFFEASRLQGYVQTMLAGLDGMAVPNKSRPLIPCSILTEGFSSCISQNNEYYSELNAFDVVAQVASTNTSSSSAPSAGGITKAKLTKDIGNDGEMFEDEWYQGVSAMMAQTIMHSLMWLGEDDAQGTGSTGGEGGTSTVSTSGMISPFTAVTSIGRGLQQISVTVWTAGLAVSGIMGWTDSFWGSLADAGTGGGISAAKGMAQYTLSTLTPVLAGIGALSFMLAFAIPFMPVAVWIMLVCGYLLLTIEAIAAAPLAVIMLATPEGEGMAGGNFQKALQMINAIILRPTLSIVGLFAAMTLSYVGFSLLNDMFWGVAQLATNTSLFEMMALMFLYVTLAYKVCEYMVSIIHKIPDQIMEWMGGGLNRDFGENAASQGITSSMSQNAAAGGMSVGAGLATAGKLAKQRRTNQADAGKSSPVKEKGDK